MLKERRGGVRPVEEKGQRRSSEEPNVGLTAKTPFAESQARQHSAKQTLSAKMMFAENPGGKLTAQGQLSPKEQAQ
nr:unnamed protein product [Digitaria exilis]